MCPSALQKEELMHRKAPLAIIAGAVLVATAVVAVPALASSDGGGSDRDSLRRCARQFEQAQRTDMESFRDFDRDTWVAGHDDDAITIFTTGQMVQGRDNIANTLRNHFNNRNAVWTWTELTRAVDGCKTATIVYDATYAVPSDNFTLREIVSVTYTHKHGRWLSVIDQGAELPPAP
jgi:hypothetical protein